MSKSDDIHIQQFGNTYVTKIWTDTIAGRKTSDATFEIVTRDGFSFWCVPFVLKATNFFASYFENIISDKKRLRVDFGKEVVRNVLEYMYGVSVLNYYVNNIDFFIEICHLTSFWMLNDTIEKQYTFISTNLKPILKHNIYYAVDIFTLFNRYDDIPNKIIDHVKSFKDDDDTIIYFQKTSLGQLLIDNLDVKTLFRLFLKNIDDLLREKAGKANVNDIKFYIDKLNRINISKHYPKGIMLYDHLRIYKLAAKYLFTMPQLSILLGIYAVNNVFNNELQRNHIAISEFGHQTSKLKYYMYVGKIDENSKEHGSIIFISNICISIGDTLMIAGETRKIERIVYEGDEIKEGLPNFDYSVYIGALYNKGTQIYKEIEL